MTNQDYLVKIVKNLTSRGHAMTSKIIAFILASSMFLPFGVAEAAHKKHPERVHHQINAQAHKDYKNQWNL